MNAYEMVRIAEESVRKVTSFVPDVAIVLGSGLGAFAEEVENPIVIGSDRISGYAKSTISGHLGRLVFGTLRGKKVVIQQGRVHYYEGYEMSQVVLPVRLMCALGAKTVILTNAAGGIDPSYKAGDLMAITGQISQFVPSPLRGENDDEFGPRFPDMSCVYSPRLIALAKEGAAKAGITMHEGVYIQVSGPQFETPEEIRAFRVLGADAVGMSTAVEAIAARHMGREVMGISLIANPAAGISEEPLSHEDVKRAADAAGKKFGEVLKFVVEKM
ncbi:MAG TPA: purine-nucleoside phosphorylase [Clostridiales bacterium]|nr:purine-nucleoside phosphorylase [Clostridiales bacterium]HCU56560.1 purine-nucleoside phosphorylase [Clostridiales bacterium]